MLCVVLDLVVHALDGLHEHDRDRCQEADVPDEAGSATGAQLAEAMIGRRWRPGCRSPGSPPVSS